MKKYIILFFVSFFTFSSSCSEFENTIDRQGVLDYNLWRAVGLKDLKAIDGYLQQGANPQGDVTLLELGIQTTPLKQAHEQLPGSFFGNGCPIIAALNTEVMRRIQLQKLTKGMEEFNIQE